MCRYLMEGATHDGSRWMPLRQYSPNKPYSDKPFCALLGLRVKSGSDDISHNMFFYPINYDKSHDMAYINNMKKAICDE